MDEIHNGPPVALILQCCDVAARFIEQNVAGQLSLQTFAVDPDVGLDGISFRAQCRYDLAVDGDATSSDHLLGFPPRSNTS